MMEQKTTEESIAVAMELPDIALLKYLPYILQDFWEIGTPSKEVIKIIKKYKENYSNLNVLDLGSGKGSASIEIASELKCKCLGIDAIDDFVAYSKYKSKEYFVDNLCEFETNDIRTRIKTLGKYDIIVLGAIGPVFGDYYETLMQLKTHLNNGGLVIIDDAFIEDGYNKNCLNDYTSYVFEKSELLKQINNAGLELIETVINNDKEEIDKNYENDLKSLQKRCLELCGKFPQDKDLLFKYVEEQKETYGILSNEIIPAIFVIKEMR
jgi:cyclopropane fatty-acyl-phospholipid synthase-like methyltransferase